MARRRRKSDHPPEEPPAFIADQGWSLLGIRRGLHLAERNAAAWDGLQHVEQADDVDVARTRPDGQRYRWRDVTVRKRDLLRRMIAAPSFQHVAFVDAAGMGKTTTTQWINYALSQPEFGVTPCWIEADWFTRVGVGNELGAALLDHLANVIDSQLGDGSPGCAQIRSGLDRDRRRGKLVLIVDALDGATGGLPAIRSLLDLPGWSNVRWIVAGRPYAFEENLHGDLFRERRVGDRRLRFRFLRLRPFDEEQRARYLQRSDETESRYHDDRLTKEIKQVLGVPRMLETLRNLPPEDFGRLKTATDLLEAGLDQMLTIGMKPESGKLHAACFAPNAGFRVNVELAWRALATTAFLMTADRRSIVQEDGEFGPGMPNFHELEPEQFVDDLWERFEPALNKVTGVATTAYEIIRKLGLLGTALRSDLLLQGRAPLSLNNSESRIRFVHKTWQEFLCAVYLAKYATPEDRQIVWDQNWIVEWDREESKAYREIWRYFCDVPASRRDDGAWLETVALLYRPRRRVLDGAGQPVQDADGDPVWDEPRRSPEFLYRTWWRLNELARQPWDGAPLPAAANRPLSDAQRRLVEQARQIRDDWWGEFEKILKDKDHQDPVRQALARRLQADFLTIPADKVWFGTRDPVGSDGKLLPERLHVPAYQLARRAVTTEWLRLFAPHHGLRGWAKDGYARISGQPDCPAIYVDFYLSWAFALWARWDGKSCRLPFEAEFERAGKHGLSEEAQMTWAYWWHPTRFDPSKCHAALGLEIETTVPADAARAQPATRAFDNAPGTGLNLGILDLYGNVLEWQADRHRDEYKRDDSDWLTQMYTPRSLRGGSWYDTPVDVRLAWRYWDDPEYRFINTGFRLARTE